MKTHHLQHLESILSFEKEKYKLYIITFAYLLKENKIILRAILEQR